MEHHLNNGEHISHGFQVSIGTIAITALYECLFKTDVANLNVTKSCENWPLPADSDAAALAIFVGTDFPEIGLKETKAKYNDRMELEAQLNLLKDNWSTIKNKLQQQIVPYQEAKRRLELVGAPTLPEHIGLTREKLRATFIRAQFIRRRFTILDVAVRTGYLDQWLEELFGKGGLWEITEN
jgi:glycerol-1-phosphate dehydrogenase [NAD(P)+]